MFGLIHINFSECSDEEIQHLIEKFYIENEDKIKGMRFYEYDGTEKTYQENDKAFRDIVENKSDKK